MMVRSRPLAGKVPAPRQPAVPAALARNRSCINAESFYAVYVTSVTVKMAEEARLQGQCSTRCHGSAAYSGRADT